MEKFIELHMHLDGAITVGIAKKLAKLQGIELIYESDEELERAISVPENCTSLNDFLKCFEFPLTLMQTSAGIREAVRLELEELEKQGVIYVEIRFAPQLHGEKGLTQEQAIQAALEGLALATENNAGIKANLILCCMRGMDNDAANQETIKLAKKYLVEDHGVVAVDLAGAEALFPTDRYDKLFKEASELGIPFTIHAGEAAGADSVRLAIEYGAKRIGHGVRAAEDKEVVELIKANNIFLEMCPTSNIQTHAIESYDSYPFLEYLKEGIRVTVNTDDPAIERTCLKREFDIVKNLYKLTGEQERKLVENAIDAAFCGENTKEWLRTRI